MYVLYSIYQQTSTCTQSNLNLSVLFIGVYFRRLSLLLARLLEALLAGSPVELSPFTVLRAADRRPLIDANSSIEVGVAGVDLPFSLLIALSNLSMNKSTSDFCMPTVADAVKYG